jgi:SSS family transporter
MEDYFLASRTVGPMVVALSLFATQYSGNSMIGYTARAYRIGFQQLVFPIFMVMIPVAYMLFIPRLYVLAHKRKYMTLLDFLEDRFRSKTLCLIAGIFLFWGIYVQFLEQLQASGTLFAGLGPHIPYWSGVVILGLIIGIYVAIGGMRGAMLAQAIQGGIMLLGILFLIIYSWIHFGGLGASVQKLLEISPSKVLPPQSAGEKLNWASTMVLVGLGGAMYAHSIQQIFASRNEAGVKHSLARMAVLTFATPTILVFIGIIAAANITGLSGMDTERVIPIMLTQIMQRSAISYWAMSIVFTAILMATLSTASGVLISLTTIMVRDFYRRFINPNVADLKATRVARWINFAVLIVSMILVLEPRTTIWRLTEIKFEGLLQAVPAVLLGLYWSRATKPAIITGMLVGGAVAIGMSLTGNSRFLGIHAGVLGMLLNFFIAIAISLMTSSKEDEVQSFGEKFVKLFK